VRVARVGRLTGRAVVLGVVTCVLLVSLAIPFRGYLAQRGEIEALQQATAEQRRRVAALEERRARWNDPAYVQSQARARLHYVMPGETAYIVLDSQAGATASSGAQPSSASTTDGAWFERLWSSVRDADADTDADTDTGTGTGTGTGTAPTPAPAPDQDSPGR